MKAPFNFSFLFIFITLSGTVFLSACKKESANSNPPLSPLVQLNNFLDANQPEIQEFIIDADQGGTIKAKEGTQIEIPKSAFELPNGTTVTGNITFQLQEIYSAGGMIFTKMPTTSNGNILVSGGELFVNAEQNEDKLSLAPGKSLDFNTPTKSLDSNMAFFVGTGSGPTFNWSLDTSTTVTPITDSTGLYSYAFDLKSMYNFINCDYFFSDPRPKTKVIIQMPNGYDYNNSFVFVHLPSTTSVFPVFFWNQSTGYFEISGSYALPVGQEVNFVGLHYDGSNIQYSLQNKIIANDHVELLSFQVVTPEQLAQILKGL